MENALVILCGGDSSRMGSDKALLPFGNCCMVEYLVHKFEPYFSKNIFIRKAEGHLFPSAFKRTGDFRYLPECRSFSRCVQHFVHDR